jgi:hypothetical protein
MRQKRPKAARTSRTRRRSSRGWKRAASSSTARLVSVMKRQVRRCAGPGPSQGHTDMIASWLPTRWVSRSTKAAAPIRAQVGQVRAPHRKGTRWGVLHPLQLSCTADCPQARIALARSGQVGASRSATCARKAMAASESGFLTRDGRVEQFKPSVSREGGTGGRCPPSPDRFLVGGTWGTETPSQAAGFGLRAAPSTPAVDWPSPPLKTAPAAAG